MKPQHVMLDIETLGTVPRSVILSVGAVFFDPSSDDRYTYSTFYANVDKDSSLAAGLTYDTATITWWNAPERAAAASALERDQKSIQDVMRSFADFFRSNGGVYVWGHGACFDVVLVEEAMRACHVEIPWDYHNVRDTRTLFDVVGLDMPARTSVHHNALDDAEYQVECVRAAYALLKP